MTTLYAKLILEKAKSVNEHRNDRYGNQYYYFQFRNLLNDIEGPAQDEDSASTYCLALYYILKGKGKDIKKVDYPDLIDAQIFLEKTTASKALGELEAPFRAAVMARHEHLIEPLIGQWFNNQPSAGNKWLQLSAGYQIEPDNLKEFKENTAQNKDLLLEKVREINDPETRQKKQWELLDSATSGGFLLRIQRDRFFGFAPSISRKSRLQQLANDLEKSIRHSGQVYIDMARQRSLLADAALQKELKKSFKLLYETLHSQGLFPAAAERPMAEPPAYEPRPAIG